MARVPCDLADILLAVPAKLVAAGVATAPQTYLSLDNDDVPSGTVAPPLFAVSFTAFDQRGDTVNSESDWNDQPYMEGELVVTVWTRVPLDQAARDTAALTKASLGLAGNVTLVFGALNNQELLNPGGQTITQRSLTFLGVRNKGKWGKDKDWRRLDVRFSCAYAWQPRSRIIVSIADDVEIDHVAQVTTLQPHGLAVNDRVTISGTSAAYNGTWYVVAVPSPTMFWFSATADGSPLPLNGTVNGGFYAKL